MKIEYVKRATGGLRAEALLTAKQRQSIATEPKGDVVVQCRGTDEAGGVTIQGKMTWAWVPKKRD